MSLYCQVDGVSKKIRYLIPVCGFVKTYDRKLYGVVDNVDKLLHESFGLDDVVGFVYRLMVVEGGETTSSGTITNRTRISKSTLPSYGSIALSGSGQIQVFSNVNKILYLFFSLYAIRSDGTLFQYSSPTFIPNSERLPFSHDIGGNYTYSTIASGGFLTWRYFYVYEYPGGSRQLALSSANTSYNFSVNQPVNYSTNTYPLSIISGNSPNNSTGKYTVTVNAYLSNCVVNGQSYPLTFDLMSFA